ncbi:cob(I)yrinic acid a,c-diamide adenosyltransferase [Oligoflexus tunisiensis]|uniref:cob(I)yrinic acid a,c-diamide adenosyltransferase n=1 Tax=Oligoflexus tunisiensis TaxID=708132 RepID=UPI00114C91F8
MGDKGGTTLASGEKISKAALRLEAYGTVDELNSWMGLLRDQLKLQPEFNAQGLDQSLERIQNELFDLGGELATPTKHLNIERQRVVSAEDVARLEQEIDAINEHLPPLANFVLPGGHVCNSTAHLARTVCRRAERELVRLRIDEPDVRVETQIYLNRLSDWLFVIGRSISQRLGCPEVLWQQNRPAAMQK